MTKFANHEKYFYSETVFNYHKVAGVNKPQKFVVLIKQLTFSEITLAGWMASFKILLYRWLVSRVYFFNSLITLLCS